MLKVRCPGCQQISTFSRDQLGQRVACANGCGKSFILRAAPEKPADPPELLLPRAELGDLSGGSGSGSASGPGAAKAAMSFADLAEGYIFDGRYRIRRRVDWGSFGTVYRAHDTLEHRDVALKIPHDTVQLNAHYMARFATESEAIRHMMHPNIVRFYEAHLISRPAYLVTEFIEGSNLEKLMAGPGRLNARETAAVAEKLALALHHAHAKAVVHRDVKPTNVLMDRGEPKLTDFGLARFGNPTVTADGARLGTPYYMSPEQVRGDIDRVGAASDQYSLGVVLYEMLCGQVPFPSRTATEAYMRIINDEPEPPGRIRPGLPPELEAICLRAIAKDPARRWPDCGTLARELEAWRLATEGEMPATTASPDPGKTRLDGQSPLSEPPPNPVQDAPPIGPEPTTSGLPASLSERLRPAVERLRPAVTVASEYTRPVVPLLQKLRESFHLLLVYLRLKLPEKITSTAERMEAHVEEVNEGIRRRLQEMSGPTSGPAHEDSFEESADESTDARTNPAPSPGAVSLGPIPMDPSLDSGPIRTSALGRTVSRATAAASNVFPAGSRAVPIATSRSSGEIQATGDAAIQAYLVFLEKAHDAIVHGDMPAAREQLFRCPPRLRGWEWSYLRALTWSHFLRLRGAPARVSAVACDASGRSVAAIGGEELVVWESGSAPKRGQLGHPGRDGSVEFSPDGRLLMTAGGMRIRIRNVRDDRERRKLDTGATVRHAAISPDGTRVAAACGDGKVRLWTFPEGEDPVELDCGREILVALAFHPDPHVTRLVAASRDGVIRLWDWATGNELARADSGGGSGISGLAFHPDGRTIAVTARRQILTFRDAERLDLRQSVPAHPGDVSCLGYHPNGRWIVTAGSDRTLRIGAAWADHGDPTTMGREALTVPLAARGPNALEFSPDGRRLVLGDEGGGVRLWSPPNLWAALAAGVPPELPRALTLSADGRRLALVLPDGSVVIRDPSGTDPELAIEPPGSPFATLAFGPKGELLAEADDAGRLRIREAEPDGSVRLELSADPRRILSLAFRPDGRRVAAAGDSGRVTLWDAESGEPAGSFDGHIPRPARAVAFLGDDPAGRLVSGGDDRMVRVWQPDSEDPLAELERHEGPVVAVGTSRDGRRIASVGLDRTLCVWNHSGGAPLLVLEGVDILPNVCEAQGSSVLAALGEDHSLVIDTRY
jgi:WD40 repeat protein/serine/threonine protein kinase